MNQNCQIDYSNPNFWKKNYPAENDKSYKAFKDRLQYGKYGEYCVMQRLQEIYPDIESYSYGDKKTEIDLIYTDENGNRKYGEVKTLSPFYKAECLDPYNSNRNKNGHPVFRPSIPWFTTKFWKDSKTGELQPHTSPNWSLTYIDKYGVNNVNLYWYEPVHNNIFKDFLVRIPGNLFKKMADLSDEVYNYKAYDRKAREVRKVKDYVDRNEPIPHDFIPWKYTLQKNDVYLSKPQNNYKPEYNRYYLACCIDSDGVDVLIDNKWIPGKTYIETYADKMGLNLK
jgi:hypothetical protein